MGLGTLGTVKVTFNIIDTRFFKIKTQFSQN